jgi:hypothetical protein
MMRSSPSRSKSERVMTAEGIAPTLGARRPSTVIAPIWRSLGESSGSSVTTTGTSWSASTLTVTGAYPRADAASR